MSRHKIARCLAMRCAAVWLRFSYTLSTSESLSPPILASLSVLPKLEVEFCRLSERVSVHLAGSSLLCVEESRQLFCEEGFVVVPKASVIPGGFLLALSSVEVLD